MADKPAALNTGAVTTSRSGIGDAPKRREDLRFLTDRTIYSRIGDLVGWLSVVLTAAALLAPLALRRIRL